MDPARLAEIKAVMQDAQERGFLTRLAECKTDILFYGDHRTAQMILDLIQGIEDAWRERDEWKRGCLLERDEFHKSLHRIAGIDEMIARAARAEAEVERLKREGLDALNEWAHEEKRLQSEVERLKAQCILAGVQGAKDGDEIAAIYKAELAGAKAQALEWKRALDDVTSREWHQRQHEIEAEIQRLKVAREAAEEIAGSWPVTPEMHKRLIDALAPLVPNDQKASAQDPTR